jgi:hypothetical protein
MACKKDKQDTENSQAQPAAQEMAAATASGEAVPKDKAPEKTATAPPSGKIGPDEFSGRWGSKNGASIGIDMAGPGKYVIRADDGKGSKQTHYGKKSGDQIVFDDGKGSRQSIRQADKENCLVIGEKDTYCKK